jgi:hypothetical protein
MRNTVIAIGLVASLAPVALTPAAKAAPTLELRSRSNPELSLVISDGNVVEFELLAVTVPTKLPNYCAVSAVVQRVWEGTAYRAGQPIALNVPCAEYGLMSAKVTLDNFTPVNARTLQQSQKGIARLDDNGELIWHHANLRQYGQWGAVAGYRVLDARMIPAQQRS